MYVRPEIIQIQLKISNKLNQKQELQFEHNIEPLGLFVLKVTSKRLKNIFALARPDRKILKIVLSKCEFLKIKYAHN